MSPPLKLSLAVLGTLAQTLVFLTVVALQLFPHAEGRRRRELCSPIKELLPFDSSKTGGSTKRVRVKRSVKEKLEKMFGVKRGLTVDSGPADSVYPISWVRAALIMISEGMRLGLHYVAAGGARIPNKGE